MTKVIIKNEMITTTTLLEAKSFSLGEKKLMIELEDKYFCLFINDKCKSDPQRSEVESTLIQGFKKGYLEIDIFDNDLIAAIRSED